MVKPGARTKYQWPICQRVLYSRRIRHCGFCSAPIPESLRFTPEETAALDQKMAELEEQRIQREHAAAAEEEARRKQAEDIGRYLSGIM
jgi:hypothetical protein